MPQQPLPDTTHSIRIFSFFLILAFAIGCNYTVSVPDSPYPIHNDAFSTQTLAEGFVIPYGIAVIAEDEYFITDRIGKLFHLKDSVLTEIGGMPEVATFGVPGIPAILHGGLMDISLHPDYPSNHWIYISYLPLDGFAKVSRFKMRDQTATEWEDIFKPPARTTMAMGCGSFGKTAPVFS